MGKGGTTWKFVSVNKYQGGLWNQLAQCMPVHVICTQRDFGFVEITGWKL